MTNWYPTFCDTSHYLAYIFQASFRKLVKNKQKNQVWTNQNSRSDWSLDVKVKYASKKQKQKTMTSEKYQGPLCQNSESRCLGISMSWFFSLEILMSWFFVLWKNALESRCSGLVFFISRCRGVSVPESRCRGFLVFESQFRVFLVFGSYCSGVCLKVFVLVLIVKTDKITQNYFCIISDKITQNYFCRIYE